MTEASEGTVEPRLALDTALTLVRSAAADPRTPEAVRRAIVALSKGKRDERGAAFIALEAFIRARLRSTRIPEAEQDEIASDVVGKLLASPRPFVEAKNPAAYLSVTIRNRFLSLVRGAERRRRAMDRASHEMTTDDPPPEPDLEAIAAARESLRVAAARALELTASSELRDQRRETWSELWDLHERTRTMDDIIERHMSGDGEVSTLAEREPTKADKVIRDRVLQRHQRMRKLVASTISSLVGDSKEVAWTEERGRIATLALARLLVRCHKKPLNATTPDGTERPAPR